MKKVRPDIMSIYARISLYSEILDLRRGNAGLKFGIIIDICRQYGIKYEILENCIKYSAPKSRLQMFIEKLHFSLTPYSERPF